jgi:ABC-type transporter Mla subunit MlaD
MSNDTANTIVVAAAVAALVAVAIAAFIAALALWRVGRDVRRVSASLDEVTDALRDELPPTLKELRQAAANLNRVSDELGPRLLRVDLLLDEAEATIQSVRATAETAEHIVRGPAAAMDRAKRAAGAAGRALASGADRIRRGVEGRMSRGDDDRTDDEPEQESVVAAKRDVDET